MLIDVILFYKKYCYIIYGGDLFCMDDDGMNVKFGYVFKDK